MSIMGYLPYFNWWSPDFWTINSMVVKAKGFLWQIWKLKDHRTFHAIFWTPHDYLKSLKITQLSWHFSTYPLILRILRFQIAPHLGSENTPHHPHPWRPKSLPQYHRVVKWGPFSSQSPSTKNSGYQPSQTPTRHPKEKPKWHTADAARTRRLDLRPRTARPIFVTILSIFCFLSMKYDTTKNPEKHAETT